jgi:hypothetical protein
MGILVKRETTSKLTRMSSLSTLMFLILFTKKEESLTKELVFPTKGLSLLARYFASCKLISRVKEYTEEFYRLNIRAGHRESNDEKVARYMNGLRYDIHDEMGMVTIRMVEDAYQMALKAEEKLSQK